MNDIKQAIKEKARQLGFILAGVTSAAPPEHYGIFEAWLNADMHGTMNYLATERGRLRRADPKEILPECKSILVLGIPYTPPLPAGEGPGVRVASYALGNDYHDILPQKLKTIVEFIEERLGHPIPNRYYTDTGPILERELAQRAGLGWIGKNTCLIHPKAGSTFFLAEILLGIKLEPDAPFATDHCGTCTRCLDACPTECILPDRTIDARRCISYLTIELKDDIPQELRSKMGEWVFGCDICQQVCPWNRFSQPADSAFEPLIPLPVLTLRHAQGGAEELLLTSVEFNQRFKRSPLKRPKRRGYVRNLAVAIGNRGNEDALPVLEKLMDDDDAMIREHVRWAMRVIASRSPGPRKIIGASKRSPRNDKKALMNKLLIATNNKGKEREFRDLLRDSGFDLVTPAGIGLSLEVKEDGTSYAENATKKAIAFAKASRLISLADDSGLEVDALDGAPGLYSARYSPRPGAKDADRRALLIQNLSDKPHPWKAHFHATVAIATPSGKAEIAEGNCYGQIIPEERGTNGFGYDPIFLLDGLGQTMAELDMEQKNRLSHRARAVMNAIPILKKMFGS